MNFGEKLSIKEVYSNAGKYVLAHTKGFLFLVIFYFIGSLIPLLIGINAYWLVRLIYFYLLLYFAAGFYYKQQFLWDLPLFWHAGLRFLTAATMFLLSMLLSTFCINITLGFIRNSLFGGNLGVHLLMDSITWQICKYLFIFLLLITFFLIPSFAFISEISGKSRSVINAYVKTKGNIIRIALVAFCSLLLMFVIMAAVSFLTPYMAELVYAFIIVFLTIVYFKMYDFFYSIPQSKRVSKTKPEEKKNAATVKSSLKEEENAHKG